jgi:hypothetical protein
MNKKQNSDKPQSQQLNIADVSKSVCEHRMTRNPKEHQENKCRLCGKPYKTVC